MHRLPVLKRLRLLRRSPDGSAFLQSRNDCNLLRKTAPPEASYPPPCPPAASETLGLPAAESFRLYGPFFRSPTAMGGGIDKGSLAFRRFSTHREKDEIALEEEMERKVGWLLKLIFLVTAFGVGYQFFPYMGDNLLQQSISLLHVRDPLFKRMGASRLCRFAIDDDRRMRVIEMGGAQDLLNMLEGAKDDKTRKEALKALHALSHCDEAAKVLHLMGAAAVVASTPDSSEFVEVENCKSGLLKRLSVFELDQTPSEVALS